LADPIFEEGDFGVREFFFGRHLVVGVGPADHADEETDVGFTGDDGRAGVAALFPAGAGVEGEAALHFACGVGMAVEAAGAEDGFDLVWEGDVGGLEGSCASEQQQGGERAECVGWHFTSNGGGGAIFRGLGRG
jgi:hypothetical protein